MKASVLLGHGGLEQITLQRDFPAPEPAADEVVVKVAASALNYHDVFTRRGMPGIKIAFPLITGSDVAGTVSAVGAEVRDWQPGDRVLVDPVDHASTTPNLIGETRHGGRAEFVAVPARQLIVVPPGVSLEQAASLPLAYATAHRMLNTIGQVRAGEAVLVLGASGGVGTACVLLAKLLGARVFACAGSEEKSARLRELGAEQVFDYRQNDWPKSVQAVLGKPRVMGPGGADVVVNFTGGDTLMPSLKCLGRGGRLLNCGATAGFDTRLDLRYLWSFEHRLLGSNGWQRADLEQLLQQVAAGRLSPVIDRVFPLEETPEAERLLEERGVFGKILVRP